MLILISDQLSFVLLLYFIRLANSNHADFNQMISVHSFFYWQLNLISSVYGMSAFFA